MNTVIDELEVLYKKIYEVSVQIAELIDRKIYTELITFINKKEHLFKEAEILVQKVKDSGSDASSLQELCKKIYEQEQENIAALNAIKDEIRQELSKASKNTKIVNAYSNAELKQGNILDFIE